MDILTRHRGGGHHSSSTRGTAAASKLEGSFYQRPALLHVAVAKVVVTLVILAAVVMLLTLVEGWIVTPCHPSDRATDEKCKLQRRANTIASALLTFARASALIVGLLVILHHAGVRTTTLFTLASIFSLVIGLAAQSMLRDVFSGIMFLAEEQMMNGDFVHLFVTGAGTPLSGSFGDSDSSGNGSAGASSTISGIVENVSLRRVKLRNFDNELIYVPNALINAVVNGSQQYPLVRLRVSAARTAEVASVVAVVRAACAALAEDGEFTALYPSAATEEAKARLVRTLDSVGMESPDPEVLGVSDIRPDGTFDVLVRFMCEVGRQWTGGRYARLALLGALQAAGLGDVVRVVRVTTTSG